ncbi:hypothetical protein Tco_0325584 [Tanacetum coccineum]
MRVSTNAPPSSSSSSNFEFQQMAATLEDKMTLTFRNEMNEMKNMMKALVPTPVSIKAVEERCTTCDSNHSFNVCPMNRGAYDYPVYQDNFQKFQQAAAVGGNSGYPPSSVASYAYIQEGVTFIAKMYTSLILLIMNSIRVYFPLRIRV